MKWPAHGRETRPWVPRGRQGSRDDRTLGEYDATIPPTIADLTYEPAGQIARTHDAALIEVSRLEAGWGQYLLPVRDFLLRSESVASSRIEQVDAGWRAFGKAAAGGKASDAAQSQLAAVEALRNLVTSADRGSIGLPAILQAHELLMAADPYADEPGQLRTVQNWIGGSDYSPLGADYVPPHPDRVAALMDDLLVFAARDDLPVVAQAAIVHAQFESIHPFIDGNGRLGRAVLSAVLRRRGLTRVVTVPVASAMLADTNTYFARLGDYRRGDVDTLVGYVAAAAVHASAAAQESARRLAELPQRWRQLASPRAGSADEALIDALLATPVLDAQTAQTLTGTIDTSTYRALGRLVESGVLEVLPGGSRNRFWAASDVLAELDRLSEAIGRRLDS
ncbi:Fic family protein [Mycolicibacterium komossense]|uniref:Fic family protein n=1 Tax=Mycolicibacterium komossense TaxID=1779 RepID=A0ABT3C776_9MYCO|nr:Fic family protein [Mycolicibacterium komossense]MCV7225281.1 Fic family protein [Mycolicibacterium komossense]